MTPVKEITRTFVNKVFESHGTTIKLWKGGKQTGEEVPVVHEAIPCLGCGTPLWKSSSPAESYKLTKSVVRVPLMYRDGANDYCSDCDSLKSRYPEIFEFVISHGMWIANRLEVERELTNDPDEGVGYHSIEGEEEPQLTEDEEEEPQPVDDESDFPE